MNPITTTSNVLREHAWLILIVAGYWLAGVTVSILAHFPDELALSLRSQQELTWLPLLAGLVLFLCCCAICVMIFVRPERLTHYLVTGLRSRYLTRERVLRALPVLILFPFFASTFTFFKSAIPLLHAYSWDAQFAEWDRLVHGGVQPWILLQPLLGHPYVTSAVDVCYHLWLATTYGVIYWQIFSTKDPQLRMQFLLTFTSSWIILGTVAATALSSVGPCYFGYVVQGENPYAPLMEYLNNANSHTRIWALDVQKLLWEDYQNRKLGIGGGISAMPSVHVATAFLMALLGWRVHRALGIALTLFCVIIIIGSVHLGWHYAIDSYVSLGGTWIIWHLVGGALTTKRYTYPSRLRPVRDEGQ